MKTDINFYTKRELSIRVDVSNQNPYRDKTINELFLLTCFMLRQMKNLGDHIVAKALAGILISDDIIEDLYKNKLNIPSGQELINNLRYFHSSDNHTSDGFESFVRKTAQKYEKTHYPEHIINALNDEIINKTPKPVLYRGRGDKGFYVSYPPFSMKMRGFGMLGRGVNYCAFHSVVGLIRYQGQKYQGEDTHKEKLKCIAESCGASFISKQIPVNQVALAKDILRRTGAA